MNIKDILENAYKEDELFRKNHITKFQRTEFGDCNIVIGENGSGKSRMLRFLKELGIENRCLVAFLDCSEVPAQLSSDSKAVGNAVAFNQELSEEILLNLIPEIRVQLEDCIGIIHTIVSRKMKEANNILRKINTHLERIIGRKIIWEKNGFLLTTNIEDDRRALLEEVKVLSPGERNILILVMAMLCVKINSDRPALVLVDEIENHLHPAALLQVYNMLLDSMTGMNCCIFIATHSIFLLPLFKFQNILFMENGKLLGINGSLYQDIVDRLVYGKDREKSLVDFLISVDAWSYAEYLAECFMRPTTSGKASVNDVQYLKFEQIVERYRKTKKLVKVLDFGAGEARIGQCIELKQKNSNIQPELIYNIYDKYMDATAFKTGKMFYGEAIKDEHELSSKAGQMDIVLLYNVLHEISIDEWQHDLNLALSLLQIDGSLIFSERKTLSVGENPYGKSGYLVLWEEEVRILFSGMDVERIELVGQKRDVTLGFAITNPQNISVRNENIKKVLEKLIERTEGIIDQYLNQDEIGKLKSREYAFHCQQYFNAKKALQILENKVGNAHDCIEDMKLQYILGDKAISERERYNLIEMRSHFDDEEGRKCRKYLDFRDEGDI